MAFEPAFAALIAERTQQFTGREWVFVRLDAWLAAADEPLFFLTGGPGSGKTAISARLVQIISGQDPEQEMLHPANQPLFFYFFCQAGSEELDPLRFVTNLALALAKKSKRYAEALAELGKQQNIVVKQSAGQIREGGRMTGVSIESLTVTNLSARLAFNRIIREPLLEVSRSSALPVLILIDALDEALTYHDEENLVALLHHILDNPQEMPPQMRFILTGRPDERLLHRLPPPTLDLLDDAPDDVSDVRRYVETRLAGVTAEQKNALAERVASASRGNFLYARYVLDDLLPLLASGTDVSALPLPDALQDIFQGFLERELAGTTEAWREKYGLLISILAVARGDGLTREQLAGMANLDDHEADTILSPVKQYLTYEAPGGPFRIYHQSFREYLLGLDEGTIRVYPAQAQRAIATFFLEEWAGAWDACKEPYPLLHLPYHMQQAGSVSNRRRLRQAWFDRLRALLLDFGWLWAKLEAADVAALIADYELAADDEVLQLVQGAIEMSANVLAGDKTQLAAQLLGRLRQFDHADMRALLGQAQASPRGPTLYPLTASLTPPGQAEHQAFAGHEAEVSGIAATRDGRHAVSAGKDGQIKIWDLENGTLSHAFADDAAGVTSLAVTPDGRHVVAASAAALRVWDLHTGTLVRTIGETRQRDATDYAAPIAAVKVTPDGRLVIAAAGAILQVWDFATGALLHSLTGHASNITSLALTADGSKAISGCREWDAQKRSVEEFVKTNAIRVWDLASGRLLHELPGPTCGTNAVAVSGDDRFAVSIPNSGLYVFRDNSIRAWDLESGELVRRIPSGHTYTITSMAITPDNRLVLSGGGNCVGRYDRDFLLGLWDFESGKLEHTFDVHRGPVAAIKIMPGGRRAVSAGGKCADGYQDGSVRVWDLERRELVATFQGEDSMTCLSIPNQDTIVAGSRNGAVHLLRLRV